MPRLESIELENFKSFQGKVSVGPFADFTAVIGANGSGKSNIMDAICFAIGVRTQKLRGTNLNDLVNTGVRGEQESSTVGKASVRLTCRDTEEQKRIFERSVSSGGSSEYRLDEKVVTRSDYTEGLSRCGIDTHTQNFMIFQNEVRRLISTFLIVILTWDWLIEMLQVETIASKSPKQLCELFEEVSGSLSLKQKYEAAKEAVAKGESDVTFAFSKKKGLISAKKQLRQQKEEADRFTAMNSELASLKVRYGLFELYRLQHEFKAQEDQKNRSSSLAENEEEKFHLTEAEYKNLRKDLASTRLEEAKVLKRREIAKRHLSAVQIKRVELSAEIERIRRQMDESELSRIKDEQKSRRTSYMTLQATLNDVEDALHQLGLERRGIGSSHGFSDNDREEFFRLRKAADVESCGLQRELLGIQRTCLALRQRVDVIRQRLAQVEEEALDLTSKITELTAQILQRDDQLRVVEESVVRYRQEESLLQQSLKEKRRQLEDLDATIEAMRIETREKKLRHDERVREIKLDDAFQNMKRLFKGVRGQLSELCKPSKQKYKEAIAVLFGPLMRAIVVDTEKTAEECINYLRNQRVGVCMFLPLATLRPKPIPDNLRAVGGSVCLAADVILSEDDSVSPAIMYAAGDALLCDTHTEARELRFGTNPIRAKICSLDGTLVNKNGFITGGATRKSRVHAWDQAEYEKLKEKLSANMNAMRQLEQEIADLGRSKSADLKERHRSSARKAEFLRIGLRNARATKADLEAHLEQDRGEIAELKTDLEGSAERLGRLEEEGRTIEQAINAVKETQLATLMTRLGFESVGEIEERFVDRDEHISERQQQLERQRDKLKSQIAYSGLPDLQIRIDELQAHVDSAKEKLTTFEDQLNALQVEEEDKQKLTEEVGAELVSLADVRRDMERQIRDKKSERQRIQENCSALKRQVSAASDKLSEVQIKRGELLHSFRVKGVHIPMSDRKHERDDGEKVEKINFSSLTSQEKAASLSPELRGRQKVEYENAVETIEAEIQAMSPNLRASERVEELDQQIKNANQVSHGLLGHCTGARQLIDPLSIVSLQEFERGRTKAKEAKLDFERLRSVRKEKFLSCFNKIAKRTAEVYAQLTQSTAYPHGGSAYLSLESQEDPFLRGVKFNAMPPTKRFRDMEQLSGGEKTVAALALLFAIHDYNPTPFFVMDEADAALDNRNVDSMSSFVLSRSLSTQVIVISLKVTSRR